MAFVAAKLDLIEIQPFPLILNLGRAFDLNQEVHPQLVEQLKERMTRKPTIRSESNPRWINKLKDRFENVSDDGTFVALHSPFEDRLIIRVPVNRGRPLADDQ